MKRDVYKRFEIIEGHLPVYRSELYKLLESNEQRALTKVKDMRDAIEQSMLTNFQALDQRVDKFSELVDVNLETLRRAIAESREVYVSIINKSNVDLEDRMNGIIDDIEKVSNALLSLQTDIGHAGLGGNADSAKVAKQLTDLEANLNTQIITEKSVRKANIKHLGQELDEMRHQIATVASGQGAAAANNANTASVDIARLGSVDDEIQLLKAKQATVDVEFAEVKSDIERIQQDVETQQSAIDKCIEQVGEGGGAHEAAVAASTEVVDALSKEVQDIQQSKLSREQVAALIMAHTEKLSGDNQQVWRDTVKLAEQVFNEQGISSTMELLPQMQGVGQLKTTINALANDYKDDQKAGLMADESQPKPQLNSEQPADPVADKDENAGK
jgi:hypothetical protein